MMSGGPREIHSSDVVMLTKNSMKPSLAETFGSIFANIPVNRLIVVDGGSRDGTLEFARRNPRVLLVDDSEGTKGTSRQRGIELVTTDVFAFVDSDVILQRGWFEKAIAQFELGVGAVSTYPRHHGKAGMTQRALERMYRRPTKRRFDTAAALIRTDAAKGIQIPREFFMSEDEFLGRSIESRGYRVKCVSIPVAYHMEEPRPANMVLKGRLLRKQGWRSGLYLLRQFATSVPEGLFVAISVPDLREGCMRMVNSAQTLRGYLEGASGRAFLKAEAPVKMEKQEQNTRE
jgi:glycosyltransferase involved in cell wall biosynthesis